MSWPNVLQNTCLTCCRWLINCCSLPSCLGFPRGSEGKASGCNAGGPGLIPGSGRSPGEGNGGPLQCSCLENPMDRGAWQATVQWGSLVTNTFPFQVWFRAKIWNIFTKELWGYICIIKIIIAYSCKLIKNISSWGCIHVYEYIPVCVFCAPETITIKTTN